MDRKPVIDLSAVVDGHFEQEMKRLDNQLEYDMLRQQWFVREAAEEA